MGSGHVASKRLKAVISKDRELLSTGSIRILKKELGNIVAKFLDIDKRKIKIQIEESDQESYNLSVDLPKKPSSVNED